MDLSFYFAQFLTGLASASLLFVIASGLTIVFGVTRIVNFAHGAFYMLGSYFAVTMLPRLLAISATFPMFLAGILLSALAVGVIGVLMELTLLRRIYKAPELFQLLATFGVVLVLEDVVLKLWGPLEILGPRAPGMTGAAASVLIFGQRFPTYELFLIAVGPLVLGALWLVMKCTRYGVLVRAATQDREMVGALGVNQALLFTGTLFLGAALAGLGGALQTPKIAASHGMHLAILTETFVVTVVGGMGSIPGAFISALIIGELQAFGILIFPKVTLVLVFLLMAAVLAIKPWGLMGKPETGHDRVMVPEGFIMLKPIGPAGWRWIAGGIAAILLLPVFGDSYMIKVGTEVVIFALAAFSLNFLIGNGGLISFGHAAYFGIGAYACGLLVKKLMLPMELALPFAPMVAAGGAALFGYFVVRLSGIYLAMLTLALAQIIYAVAFQWVELTGGDNGLVGVWPSRWASGRTTYYYLAAVLSLAGIAVLWRIILAPFGYILRAARDSAVRADAIGIDVAAHRWLAFILAGAAAGLAGGLYAFAKGSIDPTLISISMSVDLLVMVLVGGIQTVAGAAVGAGVLHIIKDFVMPLTDYWHFLLGVAIIAIVLVFPHGVVGAVMEFPIRARKPGSPSPQRTGDMRS